jgi:hypothetical protein
MQVASCKLNQLHSASNSFDPEADLGTYQSVGSNSLRLRDRRLAAWWSLEVSHGGRAFSLRMHKIDVYLYRATHQPDPER